MKTDIDTLDQIEDVLTQFICSDANTDKGVLDLTSHIMKKGKGVDHTSIDAGNGLPFKDMYPKLAYASNLGTVEATKREFADTPKVLLQSVQDLIGTRAEVSQMCSDGGSDWIGFRKIYKRPHNVWVASTGADLYELHLRTIYSNGDSWYGRRVVAISKTGKPVVCLIQGANGKSNDNVDFRTLVRSASIIEDAFRPNVFRATVEDHLGIIVPIPQGEHLEVFKLRDGPVTPTGRRKPLLHWVAKHLRQRSESTIEIAKYLRGTHTFNIDTLKVKLEG